jgi:glycosyltransferase involved in cell wall biosynthesis
LVLGFLEKQTTPEEDQKLFNEKNYFLCMTMPAVARAFGKAARAKIEADLSWDAVAKKYLEMFEEARRSSEWRVAGKWWLE